MKWPKRRRNQATHVFTHAPNKQANKGTISPTPKVLASIKIPGFGQKKRNKHFLSIYQVADTMLDDLEENFTPVCEC